MSSAIRLDDPNLFGNDAAEDEEASVFDSYALPRPELEDFIAVERRLCVARAYKGEGKSALLRLSANKVRALPERQIVIAVSATNLAPSLDSSEFASWVKAWKAAILDHVASEVGNTIGAAWSDDAMALVEQAERNGFKAKNIVSAIIDRLQPSLEVGGVALSVAKTKLGLNAEKVLQRWAKEGTSVWLFIDDVDLNFQNTPSQKTRVAAFFVACREIVNSVSSLCVRAVVRPNVWTIIKLEFEALSHVEQYTYDLHWSEQDLRALLARRVEAYLRRNNHWLAASKALPTAVNERDKALIELVFEASMEWGGHGSRRPPHVVIYTLSKHRPRWAIELSKEGAGSAHSDDRQLISRQDIFENLAAFGKRRIEDTVAEFRSQCPEIDELITAFSREREQYKTDELLKLIENKILSHLSPTISGIPGRSSAREVAGFLFEIGFFFGRRDLKGGNYEHVGFSDEPMLWKSRADTDRGLSWEVHPVFRQALQIRDSEGREFAPPSRRNRR